MQLNMVISPVVPIIYKYTKQLYKYNLPIQENKACVAQYLFFYLYQAQRLYKSCVHIVHLQILKYGLWYYFSFQFLINILYLSYQSFHEKAYLDSYNKFHFRIVGTNHGFSIFYIKELLTVQPMLFCINWQRMTGINQLLIV